MNPRKAAMVCVVCLAAGGGFGRAALPEATPAVVPEATPAMQPETPEAFLKRLKPRLEHDAAVKKIEAELWRPKVPLFELKEVTAKEALERVNDLIAAHNAAPNRRKDSVAIPPIVFDGRFSGFLEKPPGVVSPGETRITLSLKNSPLMGLLTTVTQLVGITFDVQPDGIWVRPLFNSIQALVTRRYRVPERVFASREAVRKQIADLIQGSCKWEFDERTHLLTLTTASSLMDGFEIWYAHALMDRRPGNPAQPR